VEKTIQVGLIQMSCGEDVEENFDRAVSHIREAAARGAQIVATQELFKSRYFCQLMDNRYFDLAERLDEQNPTVRRLSQVAREEEIVLIASLFEERTPGLYHNTTVVLDADGSFLGRYRKMHIPDDPLYCEKFYFTPGDLGFPVFHTRYADVGVLICWDQWFPEAARMQGLRGAEIIFIPTAIGYGSLDKESGYYKAWQVVQRGHAVANSCFVAAINRVGFEPTPGAEGGIKFWGQSFVSDPYGTVLAMASEEEEEIVLCPVDLSFVERGRKGFSFPYRDRRVDSYEGLTRRYLDDE